MANYLKYLSFPLLASIIILAFPSILKAQMFSIDDPSTQTERVLGIFTLAGVSWEMAEFTYQNDVATADQRVDFDSNIIRFRLESPALEISGGFGGAFTGMDETSFVNVNGRLSNRIALIRNSDFILSLPIQLTTDLTQARQNRTDAEFSQSSLVFGTGLGTDFRLGNRVNINLRATPNYGFSFSQGSLFGGSLFRFDGRSLLIIHDVIGRRALSLGYHFDYRSYNIDGDFNDYNYLSHSVTLGIVF